MKAEVGMKLRANFKGYPLNGVVTNITPEGIIEVSKLLPATGEASNRVYERYDGEKELFTVWRKWGDSKVDLKGGGTEMANAQLNNHKKAPKPAKPPKKAKPAPATAGQVVHSESKKNVTITVTKHVRPASLKTAFRLIRRKGIVVRQNYKCCQFAASRGAAKRALAQIRKGKTIQGVAFYTEQDELDRQAKKGFYLSFGPIVHESKTIGLPAKEIGQIITDVFKQCKIEYTWSGDPAERIFIK